jgi:hypothetical protein
MFSRYGVNYLVQLNEARAASSRPASGPGGRPSASEEIGMFLRLGAVIAVAAVLVAFVAWTIR